MYIHTYIKNIKLKLLYTFFIIRIIFLNIFFNIQKIKSFLFINFKHFNKNNNEFFTIFFFRCLCKICSNFSISVTSLTS